MKYSKWHTLLVTTLALSLASLAHAGIKEAGGGDACENRIKIIRDDIKSWIQQGGSNGLTLPANLSTAQYSSAMQTQIGIASIKCVGKGDPGFPVLISGTPKVCRFDRTATKSQITCDFTKFLSLGEDDQYVLVHHEFAGLAGIEKPAGDSSTYTVSNQISSFLVNQIVKKLAVKKALEPEQTGMSFGGIYLEKSTFPDVLAAFGPAVHRQRGDASTGEDYVCYLSEDGLQSVYFVSGEGGGGTIINNIEIKTADVFALKECQTSPQTFKFANGLAIGSTWDQMAAVLGQPQGNGWVANYTFERQYMVGQYQWVQTQGIAFAFDAAGLVSSIQVGQGSVN